MNPPDMKTTTKATTAPSANQISESPTVPPHTLRAAVAYGKMNRRAWVVTSMLVIFQIINFADKAVLGLVAEPAMAELQLSASEFGFIGSAFFFLFAIASVAVGFLAAKVPTRWIILTMGVSWAVLQFPMLFGGGAAILLVTRIMLGAAEGPATPITLQHVQGWFPAKERGLPSSMVAIGSTLGPVIAAPILAWVIAHPDLGWRWAFGFLGIVGLLWTSIWLFVGRDGPHSHMAKKQDRAVKATIANESAEADEPTPSTNHANGSGVDASVEAEHLEWAASDGGRSVANISDALPIVPILRILGSRTFLISVLAGAGCFWTQGFLTTWSPRYLSSVVDLSPESIGLVSTFPWVVGALALLVLGYASRYLMRRGVTVRWALGALFGVSLLISGISFLVLPSTSGVFSVILVTLASGMALIFPLAPTAVAYAVCSRQRAAVMATLTGVASLGGVIAPAMVGFLMDAAGYVTTPQGEPVPAAMIEALTTGMNTAFWAVGCYLAAVGLASILLLNPDKTAHRLQKFAYNG